MFGEQQAVAHVDVLGIVIGLPPRRRLRVRLARIPKAKRIVALRRLHHLAEVKVIEGRDRLDGVHVGDCPVLDHGEAVAIILLTAGREIG